MKFYALSENLVSDDVLEKEYKSARQIGAIRLGETCFIFKARMKNYYIPYADIKQCFRRVMGVNLKMCCGKGEMQVENLVIGDAEKELAVIQLPGTRAAQELIKELKERMPECSFVAPKREEPAYAVQGGAALV